LTPLAWQSTQIFATSTAALYACGALAIGVVREQRGLRPGLGDRQQDCASFLD